jgi:hypothetical protein
VNSGPNTVILSTLAITIAIVFIPIDFSKFDFVFAQGNSLGQDGDGNEASQSENNS